MEQGFDRDLLSLPYCRLHHPHASSCYLNTHAQLLQPNHLPTKLSFDKISFFDEFLWGIPLEEWAASAI